MITTACMVCGETYTVGVVGSTTYGGHQCPVKAECDLYRDALETIADGDACGPLEVARVALGRNPATNRGQS